MDPNVPANLDTPPPTTPPTPRPPSTSPRLSRLERWWTAQPGSIGALRWQHRGIPGWSFYFVLAVLTVIGVFPSQLPRELSPVAWIVVNLWALEFSAVLGGGLWLSGYATAFQLGLTGRRALPSNRGPRSATIAAGPLPSLPSTAPTEAPSHASNAPATDENPLAWRHDLRFTLGLAVAVGLLYVAAAALIALVAPEQFRLLLSHQLTTLGVVTVVISAPIGEEILFRGLVYSVFRHEFGPLHAGAYSALAFAAMHAAFNWEGPMHLNHLFGGFVFAFAYERTGSLWPGIVLHTLGNSAVAFGPMLLRATGWLM